MISRVFARGIISCIFLPEGIPKVYNLAAKTTTLVSTASIYVNLCPWVISSCFFGGSIMLLNFKETQNVFNSLHLMSVRKKYTKHSSNTHVHLVSFFSEHTLLHRAFIE